MTQGEAASHWRQRARSELKAARALYEKNDPDLYAEVLFHCHLAVELALKAEYLLQNNTAAPSIHGLSELASMLKNAQLQDEDDNPLMKRRDALLLAQKFKAALQEAGVPFTAVILFGSAARDSMHAHSDIDVAVVGTSYKQDRMREMHELWRLRRPISYKLQPIWFYPEHLEDKYSTLAQEIKKDGVLV